jgi:hypothetical protein
MVLKFPCIDSVLAPKGRRRLAFFFAWLTALPAWAQVQVWAHHEQQASAGVLSAQQWLDSALKPQSKTEWIHSNSQVGWEYLSGRVTWGLAQNRSGYLSANRNALSLAAQHEVRERVDLSPPGQFALLASAQTLDSTVLSAGFHRSLSPHIDLRLTPHLHFIHDYQRSVGDLSLQTSDSQTRLQGHLQRVGTRHYGFLVNDQADAGWGWGLHMGLGLRSAWGHGRLDVSNLLGQLRFSNIHFSQRQFQVNSTNGRDLETSAIPSVQGQYGLTHSKENLPVLWQARFSPVAAPRLQLGLTAMGSDARWFLGYGHSIGQHRFWAQTVEAQNWSLAWETRLSDKWMVGAGVTGTRNQDPAFTRLLLRRVWSGAGP